MTNNYIKVRRNILLDNGYKTLSYWTKAESVELNNGSNLETDYSNLKQNSNLKSNLSLTLASGTNDEVTVSASQMSSLLSLLSLTTWNGGNY